MKLLDSLYTVTERLQTEEGSDFRIKLNAEHFIYKAHFPGEPITPGVCIMQTALELLELASGRRLAVDTVKNVKFLNIISPAEITEITYSVGKMSLEGDSLKAQVSVRDGDRQYAKLSLLCKCI